MRFLVVVIIGGLVLTEAFRIGPNSLAQRGLRSTRLQLTEHLDGLHDLLQQAHVHAQAHSILDVHTHAAASLDHTSLWLSDESVASVSSEVADKAPAASPYSKVDRTGFIGGIAAVIETAIDFGHNTLTSIGLKNTYGISIILFTCLVKLATLPLTAAQLESTTKMQAIQPYQLKITQKYAGQDEQTKNQLLAMLFQAANVNPLAGCFPALVQLPIFLSLYRALGNLIAENKLSEPFLWIPDLEGPVYVSTEQTTESANWLFSILSGTPSLGWPDTLAFLSLPLLLFISQTISQKVLTPARDPSKPMTEQEEASLRIINNLPFIVAFFSVNVPAGLGIYWVFNNIITTVITLVLRGKYVSAGLPAAVEELMGQVESGTFVLPNVASLGGNPGSGMPFGSVSDSSSSSSSSTFNSNANFGKIVDTDQLDSAGNVVKSSSSSSSASGMSDSSSSGGGSSSSNGDSLSDAEKREKALIAEMKSLNSRAAEMLKNKQDQPRS